MPTFIISDTHFYHENIITYASRPFKSTANMNDTLIANWNEVVAPEDEVIHLGDVTFFFGAFLTNIAPVLNGKKLLVRGNHDKSIKWMEDAGFECLTNPGKSFMEVERAGAKLVMAHKPINLPTWERKDDLTLDDYPVVLCGHEHDNAPFFIKWVRMPNDEARPIMALNMSCEYWDYKPTPLEEVITRYRAILAEFVQ